jgi:hypothetical protein
VSYSDTESTKETPQPQAILWIRDVYPGSGIRTFSIRNIKETNLDNVELLLVGLGGPVVLDDVPEVMLAEVQ